MMDNLSKSNYYYDFKLFISKVISTAGLWFRGTPTGGFNIEPGFIPVSRFFFFFFTNFPVRAKTSSALAADLPWCFPVLAYRHY